MMLEPKAVLIQTIENRERVVIQLSGKISDEKMEYIQSNLEYFKNKLKEM